jgi:hypothetical protein
MASAENAARQRAIRILKQHELDAYADELAAGATSNEQNYLLPWELRVDKLRMIWQIVRGWVPPEEMDLPRTGLEAVFTFDEFANDLFDALDRMQHWFQVGAAMISYLEEEAMPYIGEYGTVSIGKYTVMAIGKMKKQVTEVMKRFSIESDEDIVEVAARLNAAATRLAKEKRVLVANLEAAMEVVANPVLSIPDDPARPHIVKGEFQSDKYPKTPRGKVPLSVKDPMAQDLLWQYAQRHREVDPQFSDDLEFALREKGFVPKEPAGPPWLSDAAEALGQKGLALNWNQVLQEIKKLRRLYIEDEERLAMLCIEPNPDCQCAGCRYADAKNLSGSRG